MDWIDRDSTGISQNIGRTLAYLTRLARHVGIELAVEVSFSLINSAHSSIILAKRWGLDGLATAVLLIRRYTVTNYAIANFFN